MTKNRLSREAPSGIQRPTIAFLTNNLTDSRTCEVWFGIMDAVEQYGARVICFPAGRMDSLAHMQGNHRTIIHELLEPKHIDGLISFQWWSDRQWFEHICRPYLSLPLVTIMRHYEGYPGILIDPYQDMRRELLHLIEDHGYRRIAFVRGPEGHTTAEARYRAYRDVLAEYHIPFDPQRVFIAAPYTESFLQESPGEEAVYALFDQRGLKPGQDLEAVVAFNDEIAFGVIEGLRKRHIRIPSDIAVLGFDNRKESELSFPPLTTMAIPWYDMGRKAVDMIFSRLAGHDIVEREILSAQLIIRHSCACLDPAIQRAACDISAKTSIASKARSVKGSILRSVEGAESIECIEELVESFWNGSDIERSASASNSFLRSFEECLTEMCTADRVEGFGQALLSALRCECMKVWPSGCREKHRAENLLHQGRVLVSQLARQFQMRRQTEIERQAAIIHGMNQRLLHTFELTSATSILAQDLPLLNIPACYLSLYEHTQLYQYPQSISEWSRLILAYNQHGRIELPPEGTRFLSRQLVPEEIFSEQIPANFLLEPLYSWEEQIGFVLFEFGPRSRTLYESLRAEFSNTLKATLFVQERREAESALEESLHTLQLAQNQLVQSEKMAALGGLVAGVAHEVNTPLGIGVTAASHLEQETHKLTTQYEQEQMTRSSLERYLQTTAQSAAMILANLRRAAELIQSFKQISIDQSSEKKRRFHLKSTLDNILISLQPELKKSQCSVITQCSVTLTLTSYPGALVQIVTNLIMNSLFHAFEPDDSRAKIYLEAAPHDDTLHFTYRDNGKGIAPEDLAHIFEPFYTTKRGQGGSGLGLYIAYNLTTQQLQGSITCESAPGEGTVFQLRLPLSVET